MHIKNLIFVIFLFSHMHSVAMEHVPNDILKYILFLSLSDSTYAQARRTYRATKQVCKHWHELCKHVQGESQVTMDIIEHIVQKESSQKNTTIGLQNPVCIAALIGTQTAADYLEKLLQTTKPSRDFIRDCCDAFGVDGRSLTRPKYGTNMPALKYLPQATQKIMQEFVNKKGIFYHKLPAGTCFVPCLEPKPDPKPILKLPTKKLKIWPWG